MLEQQPAGGAILNVASINGLGGAPGGALYSAAKAGVMQDLPDNSIVGGLPAINIRDWHRQSIALKKLIKKYKN